jgi:hypothetical protein
MTMRRSTWIGAAAGLLGVLLAAPATRADDDTVRLGGNIDAKTTTLAFDGQSDTLLMRGVRGGFGHHHGFVHGHRFVHHHGFGYARFGFYGGYRGFYGGGYYGAGYYRPYYYGYYNSCYYAPYAYVSPYYTYRPSAYYVSGSYYPVNGDVQGYQAQTLKPTFYQAHSQQYQPMPPAEGGTFPYDGGPVNPIPLPKGDQAPIYQPVPKTVPGDGRLVSLPAAQPAKTGSSGFAYPAYGQQPQGSGGFATDQNPVKTAKNK